MAYNVFGGTLTLAQSNPTHNFNKLSETVGSHTILCYFVVWVYFWAI